MKQWLSRFSRRDRSWDQLALSFHRGGSTRYPSARIDSSTPRVVIRSVLLFRIGQFRIGDKTRMLLRRVVTLRSPTPPIFHPLLRPEFVHVLGNALDEFVQLR